MVVISPRGLFENIKNVSLMTMFAGTETGDKS